MPTPVLTNTMLGWAYQTETINNILPTTSFLKALMFGGREATVPTESIELSYLVGTRKMAPFVEVNSEAVMVAGRSKVFANVSPPNIRIKKPMEAFSALVKRQPGTGVFTNGGQILAARRKAIGEDLQTMRDLIDVREEWMVAQMLTGTTAASIVLSYSSAELANFTITVPRPHATDFVATAGVSWATSTAIYNDFHRAKTVMAKHQQLPVTDCIMGATAAVNFINNTTVHALLDNKNIDAGALALQNQFNESGVVYLGRFAGVRCWQYVAEYINDAGSSVEFIGAEQAIFVHAGPANKSIWWYGAIADHDAMDQGLLETKMFVKSKNTWDPSSHVQLAHSRPLPMLRKTGCVYVLDTVP